MTLEPNRLPDLQPGDVLFYKTSKDKDAAGNAAFENIDVNDFDDLDVLCAYTQSIPYRVDGTYRPWFHVAICSEGGADPKEIGFQQSLIKEGIFKFEEGGVLPDLPFAEAEASGRSTDVEIQVLRAPSGKGAPWDLDKVIAEGRDMIQRKVKYAYPTLLTFALATFARTLPVAGARSENMKIARGSSAVAYAQVGVDEKRIARFPTLEVVNCVTAAALMLDAGAGAPLRLPEPPVPPGLADPVSSRYIDMIRSLLGHLLEIDPVNAATPLDAEALVMAAELNGVFNDGAAQPFDLGEQSARMEAYAREVERFRAGVAPGLSRDEIGALGQGLVGFIGGPIDVPTYSSALGHVITSGFQGTSKDDLKTADHLGDGVRDLPPWNLTCGPAMLWEALVARGFQEVI